MTAFGRMLTKVTIPLTMGTVARMARVAGWAALAVATLVVASTTSLLIDQRSIAYGTASLGAAAATSGAAVALVCAGVLSAAFSSHRSFPILLACAAISWLAPVWVGWRDGPGWLRSVGGVAAPLLIPLLVHVAVDALHHGKWASFQRNVLVVSYGTFGILILAIALVRDPFLDLNCWNNCTENAFLVVRLPGVARFLEVMLLACSVITAVVVIAWIAGTLAAASPLVRKDRAMLLIPAALALAAEGWYALWLIVEPGEDPQAQPFQGIFFARAVTLACLGAGVGWFVLRRWNRQVALRRIADGLGAVPPLGSFKSALAAMLGDPGLDVLYWLDGPGRFVDSAGRERVPDAAGAGAMTEIRRRGELVAVVLHGVRDEEELVDQIGAAARLAVDNERLQAGVQAQLADLRASRLRVVEAGDAARRTIERNLHDGAQQSLVALLYALGLARAQASAAGDRPRELEFATLGDAAAGVAQELRTIAHGVFPVILEDAGLNSAIQSIVEDSTVPVQLTVNVPERLPVAVERAAYLAVSAALATQDPSGTTIHLSIAQDEGVLVVLANGAPAGDFGALSDRVDALGGVVESGDGCLRVVIPCA